MKDFKKFLISVLISLLFVSLLSMTAVSAGTNTFDVTHSVFSPEISEEDPDEETEDLPDPVIMSFQGILKFNLKAKFCDFTDETEGGYEFAKTPDGTTALRLYYLPYGNFQAFRTMPAFINKNAVTSAHKYVRITYMTEDFLSSSITLRNNLTGTTVKLTSNTAVSKGEWVTTNAVDISENGYLDRYINGQHCTIEYSSPLENGEIFIKELAFFSSEEQAYSYYGDEPAIEDLSFSKMTFGPGGTGTTLTGTNYGEYEFNNDTGALDITYASATNFSNVKYMAKIKFNNIADINSSHLYARVLYCAENPEGTTGASMYFRNDKMSSETIRVVEDLTDTNGEFVLSDTLYMAPDMAQRITGTGSYSSPIHCTLFTNVSVKGGTYSIKAVYFFPSKEAADSFIYDPNPRELTINGNDISEYQIVITEDAPIKIKEAASLLAKHIRELCGISIPVVYDTEPESDHEILLGWSSRPLSTERLNQYKDNSNSYKIYLTYVSGDTLVITSELPTATYDGTELFIDAFLFGNVMNIPEAIEIKGDLDFYNYSNYLTAISWEETENVADPVHFVDRFYSDSGYWTSESGADDWKLKSGALSVDAVGNKLTYLHVYEKNVEYGIDLKYSDACDTSEMGLMLRYNSEAAFVKAGYSFERGEWFISSREGADFFNITHATAEAELSENTWYELDFTVDGDTAELYVNGEAILSCDGISHLSPGRIAVYAGDISLSIDNADIYLLSGEGTLIKDIEHTKLPIDTYFEGGTVWEMADDSLLYQHHSGYTFRSLDNGKTWERTDTYFPISGYMNVLRLKNGDFLRITSKKVNGSNSVISQTSSDEGKTWVDGGVICLTPFHGDNSINAGAGNMNDKLMQSPTTNRIFYSQNYETTTSYFSYNGDGVQRKVFCEFFYSDDNGASWTKSETDSWTIEGNETQTHFGECKILECADGTLRMYNSWNNYQCIVYSESTDYGKTWGPIVKMEDFPCSRSSMQFAHDPYGETPTTYYMVWVNCIAESATSGMPRSRLTLAKTTDGKNWEVLGDIWRWESNYKKSGAYINHVVDPFITVTEDYIITGSGFSEYLGLSTDPAVSQWHQAQRQHLYSIKKSSLGAELPADILYGDANGDGKTNAIDLAYLQRYLADWLGYDDTNVDLSALDLDLNGKTNAIDAAVLARHLASWIGYESIPINK